MIYDVTVESVLNTVFVIEAEDEVEAHEQALNLAETEANPANAWFVDHTVIDCESQEAMTA